MIMSVPVPLIEIPRSPDLFNVYFRILADFIYVPKYLELTII
jgi:hypothetical protein